MPRLLVTCLALGLFALPALAQDAPSGPYDSFVPGADGEPFSTTGETPPDDALVARIFALSFAEPCGWGIESGAEFSPPMSYDLSYRNAYDEAGDPDHQLKLYRFFCGAGAYNQQHVYMAWDSDFGLRALSFAAPTFAAELVDKGNSDSPLASIAVTGVEAMQILVNSWFDPATGRITARSCWRGLCDASSLGIWVQDGPGFRLESYAVDASYDGEENLVELADYSAPVDKPLKLVTPPAWPDLEGENGAVE